MDENFDRSTLDLAQQVIDAATERSMMIATVESCTGGLVCGALTSLTGSSSAVLGGFVTYANAAKMHMVGVSANTLERFGAVSEQTAQEMCVGGQKTIGADVCVAITGIAGPGGGTQEKPVGLVHFGVSGPTGVVLKHYVFEDKGRAYIRQQSVRIALRMLLDVVTD